MSSASMNRPDTTVHDASMLLHDTVNELKREQVQILSLLDAVKRMIGPISNEITAPHEASPSSAMADERGHNSTSCEEEDFCDVDFLGYLRFYKSLSDAASFNAAHLRSIDRQKSSLLETLAAFDAKPTLRARMLRIMVTAPRIFHHRDSSRFARNDDPWLRACVAFYGHGKSVGETSGNTTNATSDRDDNHEEERTCAGDVAQCFPVTLTRLGIPPGLPSYTHAWCPVEKTYLPITELSTAPIINRCDRDSMFAAADVRNVIPMSKRVAAAWAEGRFFLMPLRLGGGDSGRDWPWSHQIVLTPTERSRGEAWMEELDGVVLKWKNGCRPRQELVHLRFVKDLLQMRRAMRVQGVAYTGASPLVEDWKRRMIGWAGREWRLPMDEVWRACFFEGDPMMFYSFLTVMDEESVAKERNWDDVEECGFGEVFDD